MTRISGTQFTVLGTSDFSNTSGVVDPALECFIDNNSIDINRPLLVTENNQVVCSHLQLTDGPHVLTVNATILTNQTFWFDDIQYAPSASVPLDQAVIMVDNVDPQLHYMRGWQALPNKTHMTTVPGPSVFIYDFIGMQMQTVFLLSSPIYSYHPGFRCFRSMVRLDRAYGQPITSIILLHRRANA